MEELVIKLPEELVREIKILSNVEVSILVGKLVKDKLAGLERIRKILSKSKLTEEKAEEISNEINESLAKRYKALL